MVPPNDFIPFAEQTGKISALTIWVIREGARLTADFRREGHPIVVSVNISTNDIREPQFVERVVDLVREQGASPSDLRMEVTESGMMEDPRLSLTVLHALRDAGFSLSIDDFGTGYSSLSYLQKMPVAELKIDRSFVCNVQAGTDGADLLDSIIALGHRMGLSVVAEGAETAQECALLKTLGCDYLQGWFVAKAMPIADFVQWLKVNDPFVLVSPK
jgi:EAL domain-containing protein (putative c-di-GMP-specific phosphodiesterase class I)